MRLNKNNIEDHISAIFQFKDGLNHILMEGNQNYIEIIYRRDGTGAQKYVLYISKDKDREGNNVEIIDLEKPEGPIFIMER